uniref:Uncharacterized protein n=1 Tax=Anopheles epiroticus TaxID=199890 RepID=A0A182PX27_9DIPT
NECNDSVETATGSTVPEQCSSNEDSNEEEELDIEERGLEDKLRVWALLTNQTHRALNSLLKILRSELEGIDLPMDARTLLKTPSNIAADDSALKLTNIKGGQLWYHGIYCCLQQHYSEATPNVETLKLDFFVDGIPFHRSGPTQFWPILMKVFGESGENVLVVAVYCGDTKPENVEEYLRPFVTELNYLQENGIILNGCKFEISLRAIIADTPARARVNLNYENLFKDTSVKSFNSSSGWNQQRDSDR